MLVLTISGSLRTSSTNSVLLRAVADLAPTGTKVTAYTNLADLPHFNPDLDQQPALAAVQALRAALAAADAVLISSPEYAHGVPGSLKNALDWVVGSGELSGKPVGLLNSAPRATHAQAALVEILLTMNARVVDEAVLTLPLAGRGLDEAAIVADAELSAAIRAGFAALSLAPASLPV